MYEIASGSVHQPPATGQADGHTSDARCAASPCPNAISPAVEIGAKRVGRGHPIYIIAEAGVNHDGELRRAKDLMRAARDAGADAVKFQIFSAERLVSADAPPCQYQRAAQTNSAYPASQRDILRRLELCPADWAELRTHADSLGIDFLATPFGLPDLLTLTSLRPPAIKIASPDIVNIPLLVAAATTHLPLIVSTGAATLAEVESAVRLIRRHRHQDRLVLMHCVSSYPTAPADARLACIQTLSTRFNVPVGFSDHTSEPTFSALAVAAGAVILEKHLTLSHKSEGPDHFFSLEPHQFAQYVRAAQDARTTLGSGAIQPSTDEDEVRRLARGSVVAVRGIRAGHTLEPDDLAIQRPGGGIDPEKWPELIGCIAKTDIPADTRLEWSMVAPSSDLTPSAKR